MATPTIVGTRENPFQMGGHWRLTRVQWPVGIFVLVQADAAYTVGSPGARTGRITITAGGKKIGGRLLGERNFHVAASGGNPARSRYLALLRFTKGDPQLTADFTLNLSGAIKVTDTENPGTSSEPFCGVTSSSGFISYTIEPVTGVPGQFHAVGHYHLDYSSPAGSGSIDYDFEAADVTESHTLILPSSTSTSIWVFDQFGNALDTHQPCTELPTPGGPAPAVTKTEGWQTIEVTTFPVRGWTAVPKEAWTETTTLADIIAVNPKAKNVFEIFMFDSIVSRVVVGLNSDNNPIFDDLPNGNYGFRVAALTFNQFVAQSPPQRAPKPLAPDVWIMAGAYPLSPSSARYDVRVGTNKPPPTKFHRALPLHGTGTAPNFAPSSFPPSSQAFTP